MLASSVPFIRAWRSHMRPRALVTSTERREVEAGLLETEHAVRPAAHAGRVVVILSVVLPEANRTKLESTTLAQSEEAAAWARESTAPLELHR